MSCANTAGRQQRSLQPAPAGGCAVALHAAADVARASKPAAGGEAASTAQHSSRNADPNADPGFAESDASASDAESSRGSAQAGEEPTIPLLARIVLTTPSSRWRPPAAPAQLARPQVRLPQLQLPQPSSPVAQAAAGSPDARDARHGAAAGSTPPELGTRRRTPAQPALVTSPAESQQQHMAPAAQAAAREASPDDRTSPMQLRLSYWQRKQAERRSRDSVSPGACRSARGWQQHSPPAGTLSAASSPARASAAPTTRPAGTGAAAVQAPPTATAAGRLVEQQQLQQQQQAASPAADEGLSPRERRQQIHSAAAPTVISAGERHAVLQQLLAERRVRRRQVASAARSAAVATPAAGSGAAEVSGSSAAASAGSGSPAVADSTGALAACTARIAAAVPERRSPDSPAAGASPAAGPAAAAETSAGALPSAEAHRDARPAATTVEADNAAASAAQQHQLELEAADGAPCRPLTPDSDAAGESLPCFLTYSLHICINCRSGQKAQLQGHRACGFANSSTSAQYTMMFLGIDCQAGQPTRRGWLLWRRHWGFSGNRATRLAPSRSIPACYTGVKACDLGSRRLCARSCACFHSFALYKFDFSLGGPALPCSQAPIFLLPELQSALLGCQSLGGGL